MEDKKKSTGTKAGKPGKPDSRVVGALMKHPNVMNLAGQKVTNKGKK